MAKGAGFLQGQGHDFSFRAGKVGGHQGIMVCGVHGRPSSTAAVLECFNLA